MRSIALACISVLLLAPAASTANDQCDRVFADYEIGLDWLEVQFRRAGLASENAIDDRFYEEPAEEQIVRVRERYQLHDRFVMYAGNVKPHKNLERLIEAFVLLRKRGFDDIQLLITGSEISRYSTLRRAVHKHNLHKHVRFLGYQSEETLAALYRLADVFVFPSLYEGFGLPPLEAMASGTPVVVSNVSSLP